jgi:MSHA biogenesis protein MshQ
VVLSNWQRDLNACETSVSLSGRFNAGRGNLRFSAPGTGNTGSVDLTLQLGVVAGGSTCVGGAATAAAAASQSWLQGRWSGAAYDQNPSARASFGLHRGSKPLIYLREMW